MPMENVKFYNHKTGGLLVEDPQHDVERLFGAPFWQVHRADLHQVLLEKARDMGMTFVTGRAVEEYEWDSPNRPKAILGNGESLEADVILCADGTSMSASTPSLPTKSNYADH